MTRRTTRATGSWGSVVAVELTGNGDTVERVRTVTERRADAIGIRAVAVIHRQAYQAEKIIKTQATQQVRWTVSMEQDYFVDEMGFLVAGQKGVENWEKRTPADLARLGWVNVPMNEAPAGLVECFDEEGSRIREKVNGQETVALFGGLEGKIHFKGIGITPEGKEAEARVRQLMADKTAGVLAPLRQGLARLAEALK